MCIRDSVRAVHIELDTSLDTKNFIAAFKRFIVCRDHCHQIWSDCGTNFVDQIFNDSKINLPDEILILLANDGTEWNFNLPSASHMGRL